MAAQHLINLGHRHIVYTCSEPAKGITSSIDDRGRGFIRACKAAEHNHDLQWQVLSVPRGRAFADSALTALLALDEFPDAICCQMDMMAIPLVLKLEHYGHFTPKDYSIIGFDDSPYADTINLTTMRQNPRDMGRNAAMKALKLIADEPLDNPHETIQPQLVLRGSEEVTAVQLGGSHHRQLTSPAARTTATSPGTTRRTPTSSTDGRTPVRRAACAASPRRPPA